MAAPTARSRIRTHPERSVPEATADIFSRGLVAHVGFAVDGQPHVIPMLYDYAGDVVYLHGQAQGRIARELRAAMPVCIEVTLLDALVASRHALTHSANYRSAIAYGVAREVIDADEKQAVLERMTRRYFPGRTVGSDYHPPTAKDLKITALFAVAIEEQAGKRRHGPPAGPADDDESPDAFGTRGLVAIRADGEVGVAG